jgi:hypothetical protein
MLKSVFIGFIEMIINILIIPLLTLTKKVLETFFAIFEPLVVLFKELVKPIAECLRAIRLVDVNIKRVNQTKQDEFIV